MMKSLLLLIHPQSRQGAESFEKVETLLKSKGFEIINSKADLENVDFKELIYKFAKKLDFIVIGGGDGSVNSCLEALVKTQIPLHLVPLGTANNLARSLEIPKELEDNLKLIETGEVKKIDLGVINGMYFANVIGIGLSTKVNNSVSKGSKTIFGPFAFVFRALALAWRMRRFRVQLIHDGGVHHAKSWQITVCNGPHYGSGLKISEDAALDDQYLECLSTEMKEKWTGIFALPALITGKHQKSEHLVHIRTKSLKIRTSRKKAIDVDGDLKTQTPADLSVEKKVLKIIVPRKV